MRRTLIVAYGNPWRGDDGLGWALAGRLRAAGLPPGARLRVCRQLTPELALEVGEACRVVFVDAARRGRPGLLVRRTLGAGVTPGDGGHGLTPGGLLGLAAALGVGAPEAVILSLVGQRFQDGPGLSLPVRRGLPRLLAAVCREAAPPPVNPMDPKGGPHAR
jgi:hydrogenase maturation protease